MHVIADLWLLWLMLTVVCTVYVLVNLSFSFVLGGCVDAISIVNMKLRWYHSVFLGVWKFLTVSALGTAVLVLLIVSIIINIVL